ncbi:oxidoreductase [Desulfitobacterium hafniense]|nr:FAD-dependent oxidoreductase [Desulfitobacterium hafniense]
MSEFKYLFSPLKIGSMEIPNRIMMSPHGMLGIRPGSDEQLAYFEARAKGGAGFVGIAGCAVHSMHVYQGMFMTSRDPENIPKIKRLVDVIHKHGAKAFIHGPWMNGAPDMPQTSKVVPATLWGDNQSREMSIEEIKQLVQDHAISAANMREAGADGMEFPIGGGAGLQYFVSPLYNKRTDEYGGSLENRIRIILEIAAEIKKAAGRDFNIGFKINPDESLLGGPDLETGIDVCRRLADSGDIDWLRIAARGQKPQMTHFHYPPSYMAQGTNNYASAAVREVVDNIPIIGGGRMITAEFMEQSIAEGQCDAVFAARAFIADPEWPNKARRGETEEIRQCIGDVEGCFLRSCFNMPVGCTYNVEIGHEGKTPAPAEKKKKVAIIGGGPAGLQAALTAAQRGHDIILVEKEAHLGGHVYLEGQLPGLTDRQALPAWYEHQLRKLANVDIRMETEADADYVLSLGADAVIIATGAEFSPTGISYMQMNAVEGWDTEGYVYTPEDIILKGAELGDRVLIFDGIGYVTGPGVAEMLADQGKEVVYVNVDPMIGRSVQLLGQHQVMALRLKEKVEFIPNNAPLAVKDHTVTLKNVLTFDITEIEDIDSVVMVASRPSRDELYHALVGKIDELHIIADAADSHWNSFGTDDATKAGHKVALKL